METKSKPSFTALLGIIIVIAIIIAASIQGFKPEPTAVEPAPIIDPVPVPPAPVATEFLQNLSVTPNQTLSGTVTITGEAAGMYFEASFPITITNAQNQAVVQTYATAQGDWMTTNFVPFVSQPIDTTTLPNGTYTLTFTQDDPSDGESGQPIKTYSMPVVVQN